MQIAMIGLGRMGNNMARRLIEGGHEVWVYDVDESARTRMAEYGAIAAASLAELVDGLQAPRNLWMMIPAAIVEETVAALRPLLASGDRVIDGGNSHYRRAIDHAKTLAADGVEFLDVGVSGGVWGLERGYCLMIGGEKAAVDGLGPIFRTLAPGKQAAPESPGREGRGGTAVEGYLHCGKAGAGHFVKMVHNGIEYGVMAAYAEGFNLLRHANVGNRPADRNAETAPLADAEAFSYDMDVAEIAEVWRRGSVISSWLLDLTANALATDPNLDDFDDEVADSGEGRWAVQTAVEAGSSAAVLSLALFERFASRGEAEFGGRLLSAMRSEFGGHGS